jgi:hypothetical protein
MAGGHSRTSRADGTVTVSEAGRARLKELIDRSGGSGVVAARMAEALSENPNASQVESQRKKLNRALKSGRLSGKAIILIAAGLDVSSADLLQEVARTKVRRVSAETTAAYADLREPVEAMLEASAELLRAASFGDQDVDILRALLTAAVSAAISAAQDFEVLPNDRISKLARKRLGALLRDVSVGDALISAVLAFETDGDKLERDLTSAFLDHGQLPFDAIKFLDRFLSELEIGLAEAALRRVTFAVPSKSSVRRRVRGRLARRIESRREFVDRHTAAFWKLSAANVYEQFLDEYLGAAERPKPFGGRDYELDALDDWLYEQGVSHRLLLFANAGKGKSSLLVHWLRRLPVDMIAIFVPISAHRGTATAISFLSALSSRLEQELDPSTDSRPPSWESSHPLSYRARIVQLLRTKPRDGRPLVVIIDGADEAVDDIDWTGLFPSGIPSDVKFVVSARSLADDRQDERWRIRLGWNVFPETVQPMTLPDLDRDGVTAALASMNVDVASGPALVDQVLRLTSGDPLLVGLYCEDIWQRTRMSGNGADVAVELNAAVPGLFAFFERWMEGQRRMWGTAERWSEPAVRAVLGVLSQARGPLQTSELREVVRRAYGIDDWTVRTTMELLARFVVGDGETSGYAFSHPRLKEFFGSAAFAGQREIDRVRRSFLAWGDALMAGSESDIPQYVLNHFVWHLKDGQADATRLNALINRRLMEGWKRFDPTYRGFLGIVRIAWDSAREEFLAGGPSAPHENLGYQIRSLLCFCSTKTLLEIPAAPVIEAALKVGVLRSRQALAILASRIRRSDFEEHVRTWSPFAAPEIGEQMAALTGQRPNTLPKVRALVSVAREMRDRSLQQLILDRARRAAKQCREEQDSLFAAVAMLEFSSPEKREVLARACIKSLSALSRERIPEEVIIDLAKVSVDGLAEWVRRAVKQFVEFARFVDSPLAPCVFDLLPAAERKMLADDLSKEPIERVVEARGSVLGMVAPYVDEDEWDRIGRDLLTQPLEGRLRVLSAVAARVPKTVLLDVYARSFDELAQHLSEAAAMEFVGWRALLGRASPALRSAVATAVASDGGKERNSQYWQSSLPQVLPYLHPAQTRDAALAALEQGMRSNDERETLVSLEVGLRYLEVDGLEAARERLSSRIRAHFERSTDLDDPVKLGGVAPLLAFLSRDEATSIAARVLGGGTGVRSSVVRSIVPLLPYLGTEDRALARTRIDDWAKTVDSTYSDAALLNDVRSLLEPRSFRSAVDALRRRAADESDPEIVLRDRAYILPLLGKDERQRLAEDLWKSLIGDGWSGMRTLAARSMMTVAGDNWSWYDPTRVVERARSEDARGALDLLIAFISRGQIGADGLELAESIAPMRKWEPMQLALVLEKFERTLWPGLTDHLLQVLSNLDRGRPHNVLRVMYPTLVKMGGPRAAANIWDAIWDVTKWWP